MTPKPRPRSRAERLLLDEYRHQPHEPGSWLAWLAARPLTVCGRCGKPTAKTYPGRIGGLVAHVHLADGTAAVL